METLITIIIIIINSQLSLSLLLLFVGFIRVTIRGQPDEEAVLCTSSTTYALKFVSTSNSIFLIPPSSSTTTTPNPASTNFPSSSSSSSSIIKLASGIIELIEIAPRLDSLKTLLSQKPYKPDFPNDDDDQSNLYTWHDLTAKIQASDDELRDGLHAISAVEIDGNWRVVDEESVAETLAMLINNSVLFGWSLNGLNEDEVVSVMESDGFSGKVVVHVLGLFGTKLAIGGGGVWALDQKRVCVHFARRLLNKGKKKVEEFLEEWERSVPSGMRPKVDMLEGEVLMDSIGVETWIRAFSVSSLPSTPAERFAALFRERPRWEWRDLEPFTRFAWFEL